MKTILLDKSTIGNDISLQDIENQCELISYDTTTDKEVWQRISDAEIIITNKVVIGKREMEAAKNLKLICVAATGYNNIDIEEAKKKNIVVTNVKGYSTESVAQTVFGYIFAVMNSMAGVAHDIKKGLWQQSPVFTMLNHPFIELKGKNLGIIGYGTIGKRVAEIGKVFGMKILVSESLQNSDKSPTRLPFNETLQQSDILTIHTPLTEKTTNLISEKELKKMKKTAVLINAARGGVVNEHDLYEALVHKEIGYAAVDVLTQEPPTDDNILFKAPNIMITPHIAWTSYEARQQLVAGISNNIKLFISGKGEEIDLC